MHVKCRLLVSFEMDIERDLLISFKRADILYTLRILLKIPAFGFRSSIFPSFQS